MTRFILAAILCSLPAAALAQTTPSVTFSGGAYTLHVPYFVYGGAASGVAYSMRLTSTDLRSFQVVDGSLRAEPWTAATTATPAISPSGAGVTLVIPLVTYSGRAYAASFNSSDMRQFLVDPASVREVGGGAGAPSNVTIARVSAQTIGARQIFSSTRLGVSWTPPAGTVVDHYEIVATEPVMATEVRGTAGGGATTATLAGMKAATAYTIVVRACQDAACAAFGSSIATSGTTDTEYWQLEGSGNSITGLTRIVSDGNARISATRFGSDAGSMAGRVQLYYGPMGTTGQPLAVAVSSQPADAANPPSYLSFASRNGSSGLQSPSTPATLIRQVATGQGVPLSSAMGGRVRLFFEAQGADSKTRIMSIDSQDGYVGQDFNRGAPGVCSTAADYERGGGCEPTMAIGVDGDGTFGNARISNARQFKLGWPILDSTHWDGASGTFMVFTIDQLSGCATARANHGYSVWDATRWNVQYQPSGCPKLFLSAQAAFPMHVGGARYKLYYGDPSMTTGQRAGSTLPFLGPKKLIYSDGASTGSPIVDFEDWEAQSAARDVVFLWPNGEQFDATAEGYIDDYHFLAPTGNMDLQVMYMAITDGAVVPFAAAAILRNP